MARFKQEPVRRSNGAPMSEINLTPLIDVLLVLLIIFMVVVPAAQRGLAATVPEKPGPGGESHGVTPPMVEVRADIFRVGERVFSTADDLEKSLGGDLEGRGDRSVMVRADGEVDYGRMIAAMDAARGAGATRIGIVPANEAH